MIGRPDLGEEGSTAEVFKHQWNMSASGTAFTRFSMRRIGVTRQRESSGEVSVCVRRGEGWRPPPGEEEWGLVASFGRLRPTSGTRDGLLAVHMARPFLTVGCLSASRLSFSGASGVQHGARMLGADRREFATMFWLTYDANAIGRTPFPRNFPSAATQRWRGVHPRAAGWRRLGQRQEIH